MHVSMAPLAGFVGHRSWNMTGNQKKERCRSINFDKPENYMTSEVGEDDMRVAKGSV